MKYTTVNVQQLTNRKGKPWQARAKYKDVYGDANADALTLASEKLKDTFNDNTEWFGLEEEQEDTEEE